MYMSRISQRIATFDTTRNFVNFSNFFIISVQPQAFVEKHVCVCVSLLFSVAML